MSSSRFDSRIRTPGWISQNLPIRTAGPICTAPLAIFSASVVPLVESRIASDSGAIQTLRSASNGGPRSRSTALNSPRSTSIIVSRKSRTFPRSPIRRTGYAYTGYPLPTSQGNRSLPKSSRVRRSRSISALPIRPRITLGVQQVEPGVGHQRQLPEVVVGLRVEVFAQLAERGLLDELGDPTVAVGEHDAVLLRHLVRLPHHRRDRGHRAAPDVRLHHRREVEVDRRSPSGTPARAARCPSTPSAAAPSRRCPSTARRT